MSIRLIDVLSAGRLDGSGLPLENGTVTVYDAGTTNRRTVYQDYALTTAHANPLTLDSEGKATAYTDQRVKLVIRDADGGAVETIDNVGMEASDVTAAAASSLAGDGLTAPGDGTIAVNADGDTLEVNSDTLRVKASGIDTNELADDAVLPSKAGKALGPDTLANLTIACSVSSNALTIALKTAAGTDPSATDPVTIMFRSATLTSGAYTERTVTSAKSVVVSSGSTLGHSSATEAPIYVYAIDSEAVSGGAGVELAVSTSPMDERILQVTSAEGGAGGADLATSTYSTTARSNVPVRLIAVLKSTQTTAGTWAAVPTMVSAPTQPHPIAIAQLRPTGTSVGVAGVALSASSGVFSTTSATPVDVTNCSVTLTTTGRPVWVGLTYDGSGNGASVSNTTNTSTLVILRGATTVFNASLNGLVGPAPVQTYDFPAAGTYTYKVQISTQAASTGSVIRCRLLAYEL